MSDRIHAGLWSKCFICNPNAKKDKRLRKEKRITDATLESSLQRQIGAEIGDVETTPYLKKFTLQQKFGIVIPRIDRFVTKPSWMTEEVWQEKKSWWFQATKGLAASSQLSKRDFNNRLLTKKWATIRHKKDARPQGTNTSPQNSGQTRTENRP